MIIVRNTQIYTFICAWFKDDNVSENFSAELEFRESDT
jgi:hypothetical protein